jgi:hypothetical protein
MTRKTLWSSEQGDVPANLAFVNNFSATTNPAVTDDADDGYSVGSIWVNVTLDIAYICTDATAGAAVWAPINEGGSAPGQVQAPAATTPTGTGGALPHITTRRRRLATDQIPRRISVSVLAPP